MAEAKPKSDMMEIKEYFGLSAQEARLELAKFSADEKKNLANDIRKGVTH